MTGNSFAQEWPGRGAWGHPGRKSHHHRHGLQGWAFNKGKSRGKGHHGPPSPEDLERFAATRHMRGGPFGGPFGGGPFGHGPRGRGRGRARRGDVRLALLLLLAEEPRNGYQLMQTIEGRSEGRWRPSPGSVYPTLAQLEDEALIRSTEVEGSRQFEITDTGREHLDTRKEEPAPWEPTDQAGANAMSELGPLVVQIGKAVWQVASVGDERHTARAKDLLTETRRGLYRILAEDDEESA